MRGRGGPLSSFSLLLLLSLPFLPLPLSLIVMSIEPPLRLCLRPGGGGRRPDWKEPHEVSSSRIRSGLTRFNCCLSQRPCNPTVGHDLRSQETVQLLDFQGSKYISPLGIPALGSPSPTLNQGRLACRLNRRQWKVKKKALQPLPWALNHVLWRKLSALRVELCSPAEL